MAKQQKPFSDGGELGTALASGVVASMLSAVILCGVLAYLVASERISENSIGYGVMAILFVSSLLGGCISKYRERNRGILCCVVSGIMFLFVLVGVTALFFDGEFRGVIPNTSMILCGSAVAAILYKPSLRKSRGVHSGKRSGKVVQKRLYGT